MNENKRVILSEIDIPFVDIVKLMIKWSLASIPALIILSLAAFLIFSLIALIGSLSWPIMIAILVILGFIAYGLTLG